mmetsp:Transcript_28093/g.53179  ORF Transcript_28093/g.53179 Transcript_28093/m.53179 type:complete len:116 (+) Transcript_28093:775-1122(+)
MEGCSRKEGIVSMAMKAIAATISDIKVMKNMKLAIEDAGFVMTRKICLLLGLLTGAPSTLDKYISLVCGHHGVLAAENLDDMLNRVLRAGRSEVTSDIPFEVGKGSRDPEAAAAS